MSTGANVNRQTYKHSSGKKAIGTHPIELAMRMPSPEDVTALIKHGSMISHVTTWPRSNWWVYEALRAGIGEADLRLTSSMG
jgi:hypothetical protein